MSRIKRWSIRAGWYVGERMQRRRPWWERRPLVGIFMLTLIRARLRSENLIDAGNLPATDPVRPGPMGCPVFRSADGSYNDLARPTAGMQGTRFGRNVPLDMLPPRHGIIDPNPRVISDRLMKRAEFRPFAGGNALMAAWIQFMIRDWFNHGKTVLPGWQLPRPDGSPEADPLSIEVPRTQPDPTGAVVSWPPTHVDVLTHWWDGSQIYPADPKQRAWTRHHCDGTPLSDGHIRTDLIGGLPEPSDPTSNPRCVPGFWLGLGMMMTLFAKEHNAICDAIKRAEGITDSDVLYQKARLVNAALMAKIHTVDWTAAALGNPVTARGTEIEWWGFVGEKWFRRLGRRLVRQELLCGIPGSATKDYGVPFALTEEFVAVYRMHTMLPDSIDVYGTDGSVLCPDRSLTDFLGTQGTKLVEANPDADLMLSFGQAAAGSVSLHNFPEALRRIDAENNPIEGVDLDLAATDILRCRETGVPRYNDLRRALHMKPLTSIAELSDDPAVVEQITEIYDGNIDAVDLLVGLYAEEPPPGCVFSDTAFRIFLLMAPRRLLSDRFFTDSYTPAVYTKTGIKWVEDNRLGTVIARHHGHLEPFVSPLRNAFHPWARP